MISRKATSAIDAVGISSLTLVLREIFMGVSFLD
jgi:hypothetical protein